MAMKDHISEFDEEKLKEAFAIKEAYARGDIPLDLANAQMKAHVGRLTPVEIAYMEQEMEQMVDDECIRESIDEMMAIYDGVIHNPLEDLEDGHPIKNYFMENQAIREVLKNIQGIIDKRYIKNEILEQVDKLQQFKVHLSRKQNQLYSMLEQKGFDRPTTTMWLFDNKIRDEISDFNKLVDEDENEEFICKEFKQFRENILDLMEKEDQILYPTSMELIDEDEFYEMTSGDEEIGYCLITPPKPKKKSTKEKASTTKDLGFRDELSELLSKYGVSNWTPDTVMDVSQGRLSLNQINLVFKHLPVDISYVDENELVAFYSDTKERVFPRSKGVIGRDVKNCHPKDSVYIVEDIIDKFRSGAQSKAEFWINKPGMFIYILYVAVREEDGTFRGVIEMMQDCTHIRALEGSQTLLSWEDEHEIDQEQRVEATKKETKEAKEEVKLEGEFEELREDMKIQELLAKYPDLKEYMVAKSPKFKMMNTPMFRVMSKGKTVAMISDRTGIPFEKLKEEFQIFLKQR